MTLKNQSLLRALCFFCLPHSSSRCSSLWALKSNGLTAYSQFHHLFYLLIFTLFSLIIPVHSYADDPSQDEDIVTLKFSFVGTYFGHNSSLEFSVTTPLDEILTNSITSNQIIDDIQSTIKIRYIELGKYVVTIKNTSDDSISIIGGIAAISKRQFHEKYDIQTTNAMHVDLNSGDEIKLIYDIDTGFENEDQQTPLLKWNPFDWL